MARANDPVAALPAALRALRQSLDLGAVAVVGAGLSIAARFPATAGLNALLCESLQYPVTGSSDSPDNALRAWHSLAASPSARARFQSQFAALDRERSAAPSLAHEGLARLIHAGVVETVVSLNWDTALERAYERLYGTMLPAGVLFKPHGDAAQPDADWILPHEGGMVTEEVSARMAELMNEHARTLVIIGYSESDERISRDLISRLGERWKTVRVGPSVGGAQDIALTADEVLEQITRDLLHAEDTSSWYSVRFDGSRGFEAALAGERLGPADVDACPEFAEVSRVASALSRQGAAVLNGPSGSGKSITAYQALRSLARSGYEVLRLRDSARARSTASWLSDLRNFAHRKILFIDDAQDVPADVVRELAESATPNRLVLIVGVDQIAGGVTTINISGVAAVAQLAHYVRTNAEAVLPLVAALDDQIGNRPGATPLDYRLVAAERETSPWRFFYVLTGGWRRARRLALELREADRADVALTAVAVAQIAGVDAGVTRSELLELLPVIERDEAWLEAALTILRARHAVIETDGRLRCPHLQSAYFVVGWMLHPPTWDFSPPESAVVGPIASAVREVVSTPRPLRRQPKPPPPLPEAEAEADQILTSSLIAHYLDLEATPLRGCTWLVGRGLPDDSQRVLRYKTRILDDERWGDLAARAIACPEDSTAEGAQLLTTTATWAPEVVGPVIRNEHVAISTWFRQLSPQNAWALGDLVNTLYNEDQRAHTNSATLLASESSPRRLATLVLDGGWGHIYSTSRGVDRIMLAASHELREKTKAELDRRAYRAFLAAKHDHLDEMSELIKAVAALDLPFAIELFDGAAAEFARLFSADPVPGWSDVFDVLGFVLGFAPRFLRGRRRPQPTAWAAARRFCNELNINDVARAIATPSERWEGSNFPELLGFLEEASPRVLARVIAAIDLDVFERHFRELASPSDAVFYVATNIWQRRPDEMLRVLDRAEPEFTRVSLYLALMSPELAARAMRRGVPFDLGLQHHHWSFAAAAVVKLKEVDSALTAELLETNLAAMVEGLSGNFSDPFEGLAGWLEVADAVDATFIDRVLAALPEGAVRKWAKSISRPKKHGHSRRREISPLVFRARGVEGYVGAEAQALLDRFPALARQASGSGIESR